MSDPISPPYPILQLKGNHYDMGFLHARQVLPLLSKITHAMDTRFKQLEQERPDESFYQLLAHTRKVLFEEKHTVAMIQGMADGLGIGFERLLDYNLVAFLWDVLVLRNFQAKNIQEGSLEGCSTWAATSAATKNSLPILVKNRDYDQEHIPLQVVVRADPEVGHDYTYVTSAGSPGVYVAGFNETGLSLVDTHVPSLDIGPGLPTYSLSMYILENYCLVGEALEYLQSVPRLGRNNMLLADADGNIAGFEIGYQHFAIRKATDHLLVNTNHFISQEMINLHVDVQPPAIRGNSQQRYGLLERSLAQNFGGIDAGYAVKLMMTHAGPLASICRHPSEAEKTSTISCIAFEPSQKSMLFCHGSPCSNPYQIFSYPV